MEEPKKTWNDQGKEKKKLDIRIGGGGIGGVILLGGVLATAALASACAVRWKARSSDKDNRNPLPEKKKLVERGEENEGDGVILIDQTSHMHNEHPSGGSTIEVEMNNDTTSPVPCERFKVIERDKDGINGETPINFGVEDQFLCSFSPKKQENDAVSDDGLVIVDENFPVLEAKLPLNSQDKMPEVEQTEAQLTKEDVSDDHSKENEKLCVEEPTHKENVEVIEADIVVENVDSTEGEDMELKLEIEGAEGFSRGELGGEKCLERFGSEEEEKESGLSTQAVEVVDEDKLADEGVFLKKCGEVGWAGECKQSNEMSGKIEEREDVNVTSHENNEENGRTLDPTPEYIVPNIIEDLKGDETKEKAAESIMFDAEERDEKEVEEGVISSQGIEITEDEVAEIIYQPKELQDNKATKDHGLETIHGIDRANDSLNLETSEEEDTNEEGAFSDEIVEASSVGSGKYLSESNSESAVRPDESQEGNLYEEKNKQTSFEERKTSLVDMGMMKEHHTNLIKRRVVMAAISLLSSLSCSWFLGLSFLKLCLVVCFTMLLSETMANESLALHP